MKPMFLTFALCCSAGVQARDSVLDACGAVPRYFRVLSVFFQDSRNA
jgi:hypothetical protein